MLTDGDASSVIADFAIPDTLNLATDEVLIPENNSQAEGGASYSWDFGDGTFTSGLAPEHTYSTAGDYRVCMMVENQKGCTQSLCKPIVVIDEMPVSSDFASETDKKLLVFPNPAKDWLSVRLPDIPGKADWQLHLYNTLGESVSRMSPATAGQGLARLPIGGLSGGVYWLVARHSGKRYVARFVKE